MASPPTAASGGQAALLLRSLPCRGRRGLLMYQRMRTPRQRCHLPRPCPARYGRPVSDLENPMKYHNVESTLMGMPLGDLIMKQVGHSRRRCSPHSCRPCCAAHPVREGAHQSHTTAPFRASRW
jgi:hypothetical protein